jgi:hypothetical protein
MTTFYFGVYIVHSPTSEFVSVRYYPPSFLVYNFERTIFQCTVSSNGYIETPENNIIQQQK